jgi:hypothetical protein
VRRSGKAEGGRLSQRIAPEADLVSAPVDGAQDQAVGVEPNGVVPLLLTDTGERAKIQNELDGCRVGVGRAECIRR